MNKQGPIVLIEDDEDDQYLFRTALERLGYDNQLVILKNATDALAYLEDLEAKPFLVVSDINMPGVNGLELRKQIFDQPMLRDKCVPYIFFTTGTSGETVRDAYSMSVQGLFIKPNTSKELENLFGNIIEYWKKAVAPV